MAERVNIYDAADANRRRTILLILIFVIIVAALGWLLGEIYAEGAGLLVMPFALAFSGISAGASYFGGDAVVLGMSKAREVSEQEQPKLHNVVEALAIGAGLPKPRLYVIDDTAPNAFATGRDPAHGSIAVTSGLLQKLDRTELEGVLAHELMHVGNYDTRVLLIVAVLLGMTALLSDLILRTVFRGGGRVGSRRDRGGGSAMLILLVIGLGLAILTPLIAQLIRFAVSREREYLADASGALLTRYPPALASALRKIAADREALEVANKATEGLYFANPLKDAPRFFDGLFDTHPPIGERIRRLEAMG
jgi:heat shock protein HtpX